MSKRIRHALRLVVGALWTAVCWLLGNGVPLRKRPRAAFTRISFTLIGLIAAFYFGDPYVQIWQVAAFFAAVFIALVCFPLGDEEEETAPDVYVVQPDEDLDVIITVKYLETGPKGYFDDPFNPAYTHIVDLDKHIQDPEEFAA